MIRTDDNTKKKMGVWIIVSLFTIYLVSIIVAIAFTELSLFVVAVYALAMLLFLSVLAFEGWQRNKEIDGGLEDAVDNY